MKCITFSPGNVKRTVLNSIDKGTKPFQTVHIDHYGPLGETKKRNKFILLIIDAFTKYVKVYATKTTNANEVVNHLKEYLKYYYKPCRIISDHGSAFKSVMFEEFLKCQSITHVKIATACPKANGQVERWNFS